MDCDNETIKIKKRIQKLKDRRQRLEIDIGNLLKQFTDETGLTISDLAIHGAIYNMDSAIEYNVHIGVEL